MSRAAARAPEEPQPPQHPPQESEYTPAVINDATDMLEDESPNLDLLSQQQQDGAPVGWVAPDDVHYKESTLFWHVETGPDRDYCRAYVADRYPYSQAMVVSELLIPRLNEQNRVIILCRPNPRKYPIVREFRAPETGFRLTEPLPLDECLKGIKESPVIHVAKYITGASRYSIGKFNSDEFFNECAQYMFGGRMHIQPKEMMIRFLQG